MARMEAFLQILLLCHLFDFSYATKMSVIWRKVSVLEPIMVGQENSITTNNTRLCIIRCSSQHSMPIATVQDGRCYCFKLNRETPRGNVALSSFYLKRSRESDCVSKGYTVYPSLGVCIRYSGSSTETSFTNAQETCNQDGGYLIQIDSQTKMNAAMSHVSQATTLIFVGAFSYQDGEGFLHVRGGGLDPQFWATNEPTTGNDEFCVGISKINGNIRGLADIQCGWICPFFCELLL